MVFLRQEKRCFDRVNLKVPLSTQVRGSADLNNTLTENISIGGVGIVNNQFLSPGAVLNLKINILSRVLSATGKVSWFTNLPHSNRFRTGIKFVELDSRDKAYLSDYISMQTRRI